MHRILGAGQGVLLFNEMRTGKLIEFIALCDELFQAGALTETSNVLIVAPLSTLWNVQAEFEKWLAWRVQINPAECPPENWGRQPRVFAINKEKLRKREHWLFKEEWDLVLIDEAHHFRGRKAAQTQGMLRLAKKARRLVVATGTPSINGVPKDLWPLLKATRPETPAFWRWLGAVATPMPSYGGAYMDEASPWKPGQLDALKAALAPQVLRRTYEEVRGDLPNVIEQTIPLNLEALDPKHYAAYKRLEKEWRTVIGDATIEVPTKLALTLRLRQLAASPANLDPTGAAGGKVKAVVEWVGDTPGQLVVWCWHRNMAEVVTEALNDEGARAEWITGEVAPAVRQGVVEDFRSGDFDVLVATIGALKEGISLDNAAAALFAEVSWTPADNEQAAARILGPGQTGSPLVVTFVLEDTIEATIQRALARKESVNDEVTAMQALLEEYALGRAA